MMLHEAQRASLLSMSLNLLLLMSHALSAQMDESKKGKDTVKNPFARNAEAIQSGKETYMSRCAVCHGTDAKGSGRGPNLTSGHWAHGGRDSEIFNNIRKGIPGTEMPPNNLSDTEIWQLVAFIRSLGVRGDQPPVLGNHENGQQLFFGKARCSTCHMIRGSGSPFGPELSNIGAERSSTAIKNAILDPDAEIQNGYMGIRLQLKSGKRIEGLIRNEDNYSIQVMETEGCFRLLRKTQIADMLRLEKKSFMPSTIAKQLTEEEFQDLLAFLDRQRAMEVEAPQ